MTQLHHKWAYVQRMLELNPTRDTYQSKEIDSAQLSISKGMSGEIMVHIDNGNFSTVKKDIIKFAKMA